MPRYMVERHFPEGLQIPVNAEGAAACLNVVHGNNDLGVTWLHSCGRRDKSVTAQAVMPR